MLVVLRSHHHHLYEKVPSRELFFLSRGLSPFLFFFSTPHDDVDKDPIVRDDDDDLKRDQKNLSSEISLEKALVLPCFKRSRTRSFSILSPHKIGRHLLLSTHAGKDHENVLPNELSRARHGERTTLDVEREPNERAKTVATASHSGAIFLLVERDRSKI